MGKAEGARTAAVETLIGSSRAMQNVLMRMPDVVERRFGMTPNRVQALKAIEAGVTRVQDVAAATWSSVSATSRTVDALVRDGYVTREPEPDNRRATRLTLTAEGAELSGRIDAWRAELTGRLVDELGASRAQRVAEDLAVFATTFERLLAEDRVGDPAQGRADGATP